MPYTYESKTGGKLHVTRCGDDHLQLVIAPETGHAVPLCIAAEDASSVLDQMRGWAQIPDRWQSLKDWLGEQIDHDEAIRISFTDYPDDGVTSRAHGSLVAANRNTLAKMRELEAG